MWEILLIAAAMSHTNTHTHTATTHSSKLDLWCAVELSSIAGVLMILNCSGLFCVLQIKSTMLTPVSTTPDSFVSKGYLQAHGFDPEMIFNSIRNTPIWCDRFEDTMRYRGHALKRTKAFLLTSLPETYMLYRYPGFQYASMLNYHRLDEVPVLADLLAAIRVNGQPLVFNHVILTLYEEDADCIGRHHDKLKDITPGSDIVSISLGASRDFELSKDEQVTHIEQLEDGDVFVLGPEANRMMKHAVLP